MAEVSSKIARGQLARRLEAFLGMEQEGAAVATELLRLQRELLGAAAGAVLVPRDQEGVGVLAIYPEDALSEPRPAWFEEALRQLQGEGLQGKPRVAPVGESAGYYRAGPGRMLILQPLAWGEETIQPVCVALVEPETQAALDRAAEQMEWLAVAAGLRGRQQQGRQDKQALDRLLAGVAPLTALNEQEHFQAMAMALCNELAARWKAQRVSLGLLRGQQVRLKAASHTSDFSRRSQLVQDLEATMEEALDQDREVLCPPPAGQDYVCRQAEVLCQRCAAGAVLSLPLRVENRPVGAVTLEWSSTQPVLESDLAALRLACELCAPRLVERYEADRNLLLQAVTRLGKLLAIALGPRHTWAKVAAVSCCLLIVALVVIRGPLRVESTFVIEPEFRRVVPAPFDALIEASTIRPGDVVVAGKTVLARLDVGELQLQLLAAQAERDGHLKEADIARSQNKPGDAWRAVLEAQRIESRIALFQRQIQQAQIVAPIDGVVLSGDLQKQLGAPARRGQTLFEIGEPLQQIATLSVSDDEIGLVKVGQKGELATAAHPEVHIPFTVEHIHPVAQQDELSNVFVVRVQLEPGPRLTEAAAFLRPGVEGLAKIDAGESPYAWLWLRPLVNWVRMKLWL